MRHALPRARQLRLRLRGAVAVALCAGLAASAVAATSSTGTTDRVPAVVQVAKQQVGDGYLYGGNGPDLWDCSGLTSFLWRHVGGVTGIPRVSRDQQRWAVPIPREQLLPGDLVFFGEPVSHVGLAIGGGRMVDASSSRGGVVERAIWTTGVIRYGRVPRPDMPAVRPWTAPTPVVTATATARPTATASPVPPAAAPVLTPLRGLPGVQAAPSSTVMLRSVANARTVLGRAGWSDLSLVRVAWKHAGGGTLPDDRAAVVARSARVALPDARVGDLVVYGSGPTLHLAQYAGHGYMVDASLLHGKVVVRRVYADPTVRLLRLPVLPR